MYCDHHRHHIAMTATPPLPSLRDETIVVAWICLACYNVEPVEFKEHTERLLQK